MSRANCRIEGSFSPLVRARLATRRRIAAMTDSVRVTVPLLSVTALSATRLSVSPDGTCAHSIVFIGLVPLATAVFGVVRGGERPKPAFWLFSGVGAASVAGFALSSSSFASLSGDLLMVAAILLCGLGYAEGARLSRRLGGWQVISWALVVALPVMVAIALATWPDVWSGIGGPAWLGLAYVSVFSMLIG